MASVILPSNRITDRESFHSVMAELFGFPAFYGRNMDAWIDCMSCLRSPEAEMSSLQLGPSESLQILVPESEALRARVPGLFKSLQECTADVNERFGETVLVLQML